jgi:hypothetical protein
MPGKRAAAAKAVREDLPDVRRANDEHARRGHHCMQEDFALGRHFELALATLETLANCRIKALIVTRVDIVVPVL